MTRRMAAALTVACVVLAVVGITALWISRPGKAAEAPPETVSDVVFVTDGSATPELENFTCVVAMRNNTDCIIRSRYGSDQEWRNRMDQEDGVTVLVNLGDSRTVMVGQESEQVHAAVDRIHDASIWVGAETEIADPRILTQRTGKLPVVMTVTQQDVTTPDGETAVETLSWIRDRDQKFLDEADHIRVSSGDPRPTLFLGDGTWLRPLMTLNAPDPVEVQTVLDNIRPGTVENWGETVPGQFVADWN